MQKEKRKEEAAKIREWMARRAAIQRAKEIQERRAKKGMQEKQSRILKELSMHAKPPKPSPRLIQKKARKKKKKSSKTAINEVMNVSPSSFFTTGVEQKQEEEKDKYEDSEDEDEGIRLKHDSNRKPFELEFF